LREGLHVVDRRHGGQLFRALLVALIHLRRILPHYLGEFVPLRALIGGDVQSAGTGVEVSTGEHDAFEFSSGDK